MQIGLIGYGAVAGLHATALRDTPEARVSVWGPRFDKAIAFQELFPHVGVANRLEELIDQADALVIASPSTVHDAQAWTVVQRGRSVLIEVPACSSAAVGEKLAAAGRSVGVVVRGVHASRELPPFSITREILRTGRLGEIRAVRYERSVVPRHRSWTDDALRHHTSHPLDLFLDWFGAVEAISCQSAGRPGARTAVSASVRVDGGVEAAIEIAYQPRGANRTAVVIEGEHGRLTSDGFTSVRIDEQVVAGDLGETQSYRASIWHADAAFISTVRGLDDGPDFGETIRLAAAIDDLEALARMADG
jgi:predicted dehydrogenase